MLYNTSDIDGDYSDPIDYNWRHNYIVFVGDHDVYAAKLFKDQPSVIESQDIVRLRSISSDIRSVKIDWIHDLVFLVGELAIEVFHIKKPEVTFAFKHNTNSRYTFLIDPGESKLFYMGDNCVKSINLDGSESKVIFYTSHYSQLHK